MNREINYIVNVSTSATLTTTGQWTYLGGLPAADEVVIRAITYNSSSALHQVFTIQSNLNGSCSIGSVCAIPGFVTNPQTRIQLHAAPPNPLTFQMLFEGRQVIGQIGDFISIQMDFIKYK